MLMCVCLLSDPSDETMVPPGLYQCRVWNIDMNMLELFKEY